MKSIKRKFINTLKSFLAVSAIAAMALPQADDTEVFYSVNVANNLLFVLDVSGSMEEKIVSVTTTTTSDGTSTTVSNEGILKTYDKSVSNYSDDAIQNDTTTTTGGNQWSFSSDLDFEPSNAVGLRFFGFNGIPSNATVTNAYIRFRSDGNFSDDTDINISIENSDWANDYSWYPLILNRPYFGSVPWTVTDNWDSYTQPVTPDLSGLIQQVIDTQGSNWGWWNNSYFMNSIAFKFITASGERDVKSADDSNVNKRPYLYVEYNIDGGSTQVFDSSAGYNSYYREYYDAEQEITTTDDQINDGTTLTFDDTQDVAVRFNLDENASTRITQGSVIKAAYITFTASETNTNDSEIHISLEDTGDAKPYTSSYPKIKERSYVNDLLWEPEAWTNGTEYQTPEELKELVQIAVNRDDWDNSIAFLLHSNAGKRVAFAQDHLTGTEPKLHIEFLDIGNVDEGTVETPTTITETRIETRLKFMQEALEEVLSDPETPNLNVGLMKYSGMERDPNQGVSSDNVRKHYVGGVVFPVQPISALATDTVSATSGDNLPDPATGITVGQYIPQIANQWAPLGGTPIVDALYEAALYFRGEEMHFGREKNNSEHINNSGSHPSTYFGGAAISNTVRNDGRSSIAKPRYKSPIKSECQSNYMVLMSDGAPTYYNSSSNTDQNLGPFARDLKGTGSAGELRNESDFSSCLAGNAEAGNVGSQLIAGTCGREITQYLATHDQMPTAGRGLNAGVEDKQVVKTFTIGFGSGLEDGAKEYLESLTTVDGQGFYAAEDKAQLKSAFKQIIKDVAEPSGSLASPGYSVNVKSGLEHEKDIYVPVFTRKNSSRWAGNLKKFKIVDEGGKRTIQSRTGNYAVDEWGGFNDDETTGAIDYWSTTTDDAPDGVAVEKGGLANLLVPEDRKLYSNLDCATAPATGCVLNANNNKLDINNALNAGRIENSDLEITTDLINYLGVNNAEEARVKLINFIRGWEGGDYDASATPKGSERKHMGDMLHSEPLVITYDKGAADGSGKKQYIFAATNEGYLHVFNPAHDKTVDPDAGKEMFAFMPKELLKNIKPQFLNRGTAEDHKYGIDGVISYWHDDKNHDGNVNGTDTVYLYFGLRRGGNSFYALDVTNIDNPKLLWMKTKQPGALSNMGQSWSAPYLARVGIDGGTPKEVVIVSGGYDGDEDRNKLGTKKVNNASSTVVADEGNDIFIFDAKEGTLLWSLRNSMNDTTSITNSIPGGVKMMDVNKNGLLDRLYFGDTGGNVWRLDLSEAIGSGTDTESVLTKLASLGVDSARKFYNEPDVAIMKTNGKTIFTVSIGSGYRAHPKDRTISDKFFVLKDTSPYYPLANDYEAIVIDNLASVSISGTEGSLSVNRSGFDDATKDKGWYVSFEEGKGEKVLAPSVTYDGIVTFTSLLPEIVTSGLGVDPCLAPVTQGRHYALDIITGKAAVNFDDSTETNKEDRYDAFQTVSKGEIPGKPQIVFNAVTQGSNENDSGTVTSQVCLHPVDIRIGKKRSQSSGYDACRLESVYWNDPEEK